MTRKLPVKTNLFMRRTGLPAALVAIAFVAGGAAPITAQAAVQAAPARESLAELEVALSWKTDAKTTYAAVVPAVNAAIEALAADRADIPQYADFQASLQRLRIESEYLLELSSKPDYAPGVLDSAMFLEGAVAEWNYQVKFIDDNLQVASRMQPVEKVEPASEAVTTGAAGTEFQDFPLAPEMVVVPGGSYLAGATSEEQAAWAVPENRRNFETPQRTVTIDDQLAFGKTEVTLDQFAAFVQETGYLPRGGARWWDPANPSAMTFDESLDYLNPGFPQTGDSPVTAVTRQDATAYAAWLSAKTGQEYRLPTEDEWEWAARGGSTGVFFWGDTIDQVAEYANSFDTSSKLANGFSWAGTNVDDGFPYTAPVGSFEANGFGLYDMTGNVREFMADNWVLDPSASANDGSVRNADVPFPVLRGGAWNYQPQNLRIDYRSAYFSSEVATNMFGFRLVREL